ncbi:MAG TPA: hypothetical protein VKA67_07715 [Verrucomicrobiae bacterium]|nr:hypothetical protein [Verrucomicrobiae bacterium]
MDKELKATLIATGITMIGVIGAMWAYYGGKPALVEKLTPAKQPAQQ